MVCALIVKESGSVIDSRMMSFFMDSDRKGAAIINIFRKNTVSICKTIRR